MCGIGGIVALGAGAVDRSQVEELGHAQAHRGPDDSGIYHTSRVGLAHRRLSIIDLSPAGHGPMPNEDRTLWITYNGEVYNYRELMPDLLARGHRFASECDTEVVLHAYEEYGERCVERFNGMFAFAIWDERTGCLFCARDRCGVKPFYYCQNGQYFAFASELKALLRLPWVRRRPNDAAIFDYLLYGYVDHSDETFVEGIRALAPAHTLLVGDAPSAPRRYWAPPAPDPAHLVERPGARGMRDAAEDFGALLRDSVRLRLRSDVTVGSCLSGGLDSSTIVCLANELLFPRAAAGGPQERWHLRGEQQKTFSACYDDRSIDERPYIERVIRQTGAASHLTFPSGENLMETLRAVVWHQDEPFLSTSIVAQWEVMRLARENGVKVLLDGQGADELLCGYPGYVGPFLADLLAAGDLAALGREAALVRRYQRGRYGSEARLLAQALRARHAWLRPRLRSRLDASRTLPAWMDPALARDADGHPRGGPVGFSADQPGYLPAVTHWLFTRGSLPALLRYEDRNSMAFGVEARVPFLDYRLVEYVFRAPNALRLQDGLGKRVLREATRGLIPEAVRRRRDKIGFNTPEVAWLRGPARETTERILGSPSLARRGYLRPQVVRDLTAQFMGGAPVSAALIWRWLNLELWLRTFIDRAEDVLA
jgi:asparagine synthase (glutamine-hydrolysing)